MQTRTAHRTCPLCEATCGLELTLVDDRITRVRGDDEDVFSRGYICPKGALYGELEHDPDRLTRPLVKVDGRHVEVSWDEAFERVAELLTPILESDRNAVAAYVGNPNVHNVAGQFYLRPLLKALGTRSIFSASTVDQMPKHISSGYLFGSPVAIPVPDLDRTDHLLLLGANPHMSNGSLCTAPDFPGRLRAIRDRGGKVVVIDPRRTRTAEKASEHHFIRPGTDPYLLLAMVATLDAEGLVDLGHLAGRVDGLDVVLDAARVYTPEQVAPTCGIPAEEIRRLARELAAAERGAVYGRIGTHTVPFGTLAAWLVDVLNVITGNLDRAGGVMWPLAAHDQASGRPKEFRTGRWHSRVRGLPEVLGELPVATLADEILTEGDGRVRALVTVAGNPVVSTPDAGRLDEALQSLDAMVSVDIYLNETTRHADVILPSPPDLTRPHYDGAFYRLAVRNVANYSPPVVELADDAMPEWEILAKLSLIALGQPTSTPPSVADEFVIRLLVEGGCKDPEGPIAGRDPDDVLAQLAPRTGPDRVLDYLLRVGAYGDGFGRDPDGLTLERLAAREHGLDLGPLQPRLDDVIRHPSGQVHLAAEVFLDDLERLREAQSRFMDASHVLVGRRHVRSNNSWMHNIAGLNGGSNRCTLHLHPEDAAALGVDDGAVVEVRSRAGAVEAPVEVTEDIMRGVVSLPHGWGHDVEGVGLTVARDRPGVNSNVLTDATDIDVPSGNAVLNAIPVTLAAV